MGISGFHSKSPEVDSTKDHLIYSVALTSSSSALADQASNQDSRCVHLGARNLATPDLTQWTHVGTAPALDGLSVSKVSLKLLQQQATAEQSFLVVRIQDTDGNVLLTKSHQLRFSPLPSSSPLDCDAALGVCRLIQIGIGGILDERYGAVPFGSKLFNFVPGEPIVHSSGEEYSPITKAGISIGVIVGTTLLIALLIALICGRGDSDSGAFTSAGTAAVEPSGPRTKIGTENQATTVNRQFPSTELNLDHRVNIDEPIDENPAQTGRTNLSGVLDSKTPSGRDFRHDVR